MVQRSLVFFRIYGVICTSFYFVNDIHLMQYRTHYLYEIFKAHIWFAICTCVAKMYVFQCVKCKHMNKIVNALFSQNILLCVNMKKLHDIFLIHDYNSCFNLENCTTTISIKYFTKVLKSSKEFLLLKYITLSRIVEPENICSN